MNTFDRKLNELGQYPLKADRLDTFVVNFGLRRNTKSMFFYSEALNDCTEEMSLENINKTLEILKANSGISLVEITGTSPETNPHFKYFVKSASEMGKKLAVVSNPAVYTEAGMEDMPEFLAEHRVKILAFVPHYDKALVDKYTGEGTYGKIVAAFKKLNSIGYSGEDSDLTTAFVYFPAEPEIVGDREALKKEFLEHYKEKHGIDFNHFIVFNTIPIGRYKHESYMAALQDDYNPGTLKNLPCRHAVSIGPDGRLHDCDFMVAADRQVSSNNNSLDSFDYSLLINREVAASEMCFICTAGEGATCADCFT